MRRPLPALPGRIVDLRPDRLVVEFEAPADGLDVPAGTVEIYAADAFAARATIVVDGSTRPGPVDAGLTVRLVLEISDAGEAWNALVDGSATPVLRWKGRRGEVVVELERD